jgi:hypothetical protein
MKCFFWSYTWKRGLNHLKPRPDCLNMFEQGMGTIWESMPQEMAPTADLSNCQLQEKRSWDFQIFQGLCYSTFCGHANMSCFCLMCRSHGLGLVWGLGRNESIGFFVQKGWKGSIEWTLFLEIFRLKKDPPTWQLRWSLASLRMMRFQESLSPFSPFDAAARFPHVQYLQPSPCSRDQCFHFWNRLGMTKLDKAWHDSVFPPWDPIGATGLRVSGGGVGFYVHTWEDQSGQWWASLAVVGTCCNRWQLQSRYPGDSLGQS